ncbi:MAG: Holliday junction branch migration protein RuvA [Acidobacteria bacterium]|nr:Holliday junction branch migration protein RuvA [Acidobacteriota bacterium]
MIGYLKGRLLRKKPNTVLLDVHGIGYEVSIPLSTFYELPGEGNEVSLNIHTHVREDALLLFGFHAQREKDLFLKLISISGIGPKLAVVILSGAQVEDLAAAISAGNLPRLTAIPGVGRKTAERIVLELKSQMTAFLLPEQTEATQEGKAFGALEEDVLSALVNLGYPRPAAEKALKSVLHSEQCERTFEDVLRNTLQSLSG